MKVRIPNQGVPANMNQMLKQAQKMQEKMAAQQEELADKEYTVNSGGESVSDSINGKKEILSVNIKPEIIDPDDPETHQDIIVAAVNEAIKPIESTHAAEMQKITGPIGGMGGF